MGGKKYDFNKEQITAINQALNIPHFTELMCSPGSTYDIAISNKLDRIEEKLDVLLEEKRMNDLAKKLNIVIVDRL